MGIEVEDPNNPKPINRKKKTKGFIGENDDGAAVGPSVAVVAGTLMHPSVPLYNPKLTEVRWVIVEPTFGSIRTTHTETLPDGDAKTHLNIRCTLMDIAKATGLRHEDVAFAMEDCGLLLRRQKDANTNASPSRNGDGTMTPEEREIIYVSAEMVEKVAKERNVKHKCILDPVFVLL